MNMRTLFRLLLAVIFVGGFYVFITVRDRASGVFAGTGAPLLDLEPEIVDRLDLETADWKVQCRKEHGRWRLLAPMQAAADVDVVDRIVNELTVSTREDVITPDQMKLRNLTLESYGLEKPAGRIIVGSGSMAPVTVLIGALTPFPGSVFVKRSDEPVVATVRTNLLAALPADSGVFRDRRLLEGKPSSITQLEIERRSSGFVQMTLDQGEWRLVQPVSDRADGFLVHALLNDLLAVEVLEIISTNQADPVAYGLGPDMAEATLTVWQAGDSPETKVDLGRIPGPNGDRVCARINSSGPILEVQTNILKVLSFRGADLRDRVRLRFNTELAKTVSWEAEERRLVARRSEEGWLLVEPTQTKADAEQIRRFLSALPGLAAVSFEEEHVPASNAVPLCQIRVWTGEVAGVNGGTLSPEAMLRVLRKTADDRYLADTGTGPGFYLNGQQVRQILGPEPFWDPLRFRDMQVLNLSTNRIQRLTLTRGEVTHVVEREEGGSWLSHDGRKVDMAALETLLATAGNLRAARLEPPKPDGTGYGFETPSARIDFGLAGSDGIQKTLLIGLADAAGNRFARVQGQDLVFVLNAETAASLMRDLLQ